MSIPARFVPKTRQKSRSLYQATLLKRTVGRLAAAFEFLADVGGDHHPERTKWESAPPKVNSQEIRTEGTSKVTDFVPGNAFKAVPSGDWRQLSSFSQTSEEIMTHVTRPSGNPPKVNSQDICTESTPKVAL